MIPQEVKDLIKQEELLKAAIYLVYKCGYSPKRAKEIVWNLLYYV